MSLEDEIAATQAQLQPLFAKPSLKDKLLSKPPFRFIHDVISAVQASTGFAQGLYDDREDLHDAKAIKEKAAKLEYLERIILMVAIFHGSTTGVKASKVVSGLEPELTNKWFQSLAAAATTHTPETSAEAVRRALAKEQPDPNNPASKPVSAAPEAKAPEAKAPVEDEDAKAEEKQPAKEEAAEPKQSEPRHSSIDEPKSGGGLQPRAENYDTYIEQCTGEIAVTQALLGDIIKKPKLSEKLLTKPPFRFLHDVVSEVTAVTGFATGLFEEHESDAKAIKDKQIKIGYLEKVIQLVGLMLNTIVEARPAKIVAGQDMENTNRLLQLLAVCAKHCPDSTEGVASLRGGGARSQPEQPLPAKESAPPPKEPEAEPEAKPDARTESEPKQRSKPRPSAAAIAVAKETEEPLPASKKKEEVNDHHGGDDFQSAKKGDDADDQALFMADEAEPKMSMRPTTARRRPPKVKEHVQQLEQPGVMGSTTVGADKPKVAGIMVDGVDEPDSDEEDAKQERLGKGSAVDTAEGQSKLVQDIMGEAAKENELKEDHQAEEKQGGGIRMGRLRKTGKEGKATSMSSWSEKDIENLRQAVQKLCQSTTPLGKCMDYVTEDLSSMSKELELWQREYRTKEEELEKERKISEESIQPLRLELMELDEKLKEEVSRITSMKAQIIKNDQRIEQVLQLVMHG